MQIAANLNLVLPVRVNDEGEVLLWAYHTPISTEVFKANYRIIAQTNASIWGSGMKFAATAGPRIAELELLDHSKKDAEENGTQDFGPSLLAEIRRLTYIMTPTANGFEPLLADIAISRNAVDAEDWEEAQSAIVFFTVGYAISRRAGRKTFCETISSVMGGSTTSLSASEYAASLSQSTPAETSAPAIEAVSAEVAQ